MKQLDILSKALLIVGGVNWGLVGATNFDLVAAITGAGTFGNKNLLGSIVYGLVGLAAVYQALRWKSVENRYATVA